MKTTTTTEKVEREYQTGEFVTVTDGERTVDAFIGTIDYVKRDAIAGYTPGKYAENYKKIVWDSVFFVRDVDHDTETTFDNLTDAVECYFNTVSAHKVISQERVLVDGSRDSCTLAYRWY